MYQEGLQTHLRYICILSFVQVMNSKFLLTDTISVLSEDWNCLNDYNMDDACNTITDKFMKSAKESIPNKEVTILPSDKPWYDSEIRRHSHKRDRLKIKAVKTGNTSRLD